MDSFRKLGLLNQTALAGPVQSWPGLLGASIGQTLGTEVKERDLLVAVQDVLGRSDEEAVEALKW